MTKSAKRYVVAQTPRRGAWLHYLSGWHGDVPAWDDRRARALKLDEQTALQLVERFDERYRCPASGLRNYVEEVS